MLALRLVAVTAYCTNCPGRTGSGAAVMAMGTIGQFVVRRAIGSLVGGGSPKNKGRSIFGGRANDGLVDDAQIITETMMVRRVRIRRQA